MHEHFDEHYEWDADGVLRKKKRVARQGDTIRFPMTAMDQANGFSRTFSDGSVDHTSPHQPGYRFADVNDAARISSEEAYRARSARMADAWRHKGQQHDQTGDHRATPCTSDLDRLRALAEASYEARRVRMQNAWRNR